MSAYSDAVIQYRSPIRGSYLAATGRIERPACPLTGGRSTTELHRTGLNGDPDGTRTRTLLLDRQAHWPIMLQDQKMAGYIKYTIEVSFCQPLKTKEKPVDGTRGPMYT